MAMFLTVRDLIDRLNAFDPDTVLVDHIDGDMYMPVNSIEMRSLELKPYSFMDRSLTTLDGGDPPGINTVIIEIGYKQ